MDDKEIKIDDEFAKKVCDEIWAEYKKLHKQRLLQKLH